MTTDYLKPHPTDSRADELLKLILPDYKAEIRRTHSLAKRKGDVKFGQLVEAAEVYLKSKLSTGSTACTSEARR